MKLLIIGSTKSKESRAIKAAAIGRDHQSKIVPLSKLILGGSDKLTISTEKIGDIADFEVALFRAITPRLTEAGIVAQYLQNRRRIIVDEVLAKGNYAFHKFAMHCRLWAKDIPQPATFLALNKASVERALEIIKPPFIVKHIKGMRGRDNFYFETQQQVLAFFNEGFNEKAGFYVVQQWYPAKHYYRVLVLGGQVLGAIKRLSLHCLDRPDLPLAQRAQPAILTEKLSEISLQATKALNFEFAGVDVIADSKGKYGILEVNRAPKFDRFVSVTGIDVAEKIVEYLEKKRL